MLGCTIAMLKTRINTETYIALVGAFALIVREIADDYFNRQDRKQDGGSNANGKLDSKQNNIETKVG